MAAFRRSVYVEPGLEGTGLYIQGVWRLEL